MASQCPAQPVEVSAKRQSLRRRLVKRQVLNDDGASKLVGSLSGTEVADWFEASSKEVDRAAFNWLKEKGRE